MAVKTILERADLGFVSPARFTVACFGAPGGWDNDLIQNRVVRASLPGRSFSTHDYLLGSAPVSKVPYRTTYTGSVSVSFRLDPEMKIRTMLEAWHEEIYNNQTGEFGFYQDYTAGMSIGVYNSQLEQSAIYTCNLFRVYPVAINAVELAADSQNAYAVQSVEFAFHTWQGA